MTGRDSDVLGRTLSRVLTAGSLVSTALLALGLAATFGASGSRLPDLLLDAGLIVLMATPAARVTVSLIDDVARRDWAFAGLTGTVLVILAAAVLLAF